MNNQENQLDQTIQRQIQALVSNPNWNVLYNFKDYLIALWAARPLRGENEFQTVANALELDAKKAALEEFINNIEKIAHEYQN